MKKALLESEAHADGMIYRVWVADLKQTTRYFSSKDGYIWDLQIVEIRGLQSQRDRCKSLQSKGRSRL